MPDGPPPLPQNEGDPVGSDDDIPMPDSPPPGTESKCHVHFLFFDLSHARELVLPPLPPPPMSYTPTSNVPPPPPHPAGFSGFVPPPPPTAPPGFVASTPGFPPFPPMLQQQYVHQPPPPGFFGHHQQPMRPMADPMSNGPQRGPQPPVPVPHRRPPPRAASSATPAAISAAATVFAEPELRDFKAEATAFVPAAALKRQKAGTRPARVNAAPGMTVSEESPETGPARPDLLAALKHLGPTNPAP